MVVYADITSCTYLTHHELKRVLVLVVLLLYRNHCRF